MTGHGGYLLQYDRLTNEEKLEMYLKLEPELLIFDEARNKAEIEKLQTEKSELEKNKANLESKEKDVENLKKITEKIERRSNEQEKVIRILDQKLHEQSEKFTQLILESMENSKNKQRSN